MTKKNAMSDKTETTHSPFGIPGDPLAEGNPYATLGVDRDADMAGVRSAFRAKLRRAESDEERAALHEALDALTHPRSRLLLDLFAPRESRLHDEIVRRYGALVFELEPDDLSPLLMCASDLEWGDPVDDFEVPGVPRVVFESMLPAPPRGDELVVPDRRK
jgi:hypothetical protein